MKLELREFVESVKQMHNRSGVKRTRLMLKLRPFHSRKTFILKATDGNTTLTTRVAHQGQLKIVENMVNTFVSTCTAATLQAADAAAAHASTSAGQNAASSTNHTAQATTGKGATGTQSNNKKSGSSHANTGNAKSGGKKKGKK